ncbi:MAG: tetratricopeptide repeat protein [Candidatus Latescibacteria bacterium]|nr:tetratricopeptide repeat protein [Candidatus Latescibacterota bacterium]
MRTQNLVFICLAAASLSCGGGVIHIERFEPIVRRNPTEADRYFNRGFALSLLERDEDAAQAFAEAARLAPGDTEALFDLGMEYNILGDAKLSAEAFQKALNGEPVVTTHFRMGVAYFNVERYPDAMREFSLAIKENEPHPTTIHYRLGMAYMALKRYQQAVEAFEQALQINNDVAARIFNVYYYLGTSFQMLGRYPEALDALKRSISYQPDFPYSYYNLAILHLTMGDAEKARAVYETLKEKNPQAAAMLLKTIEKNETAKE